MIKAFITKEEKIKSNIKIARNCPEHEDFCFKRHLKILEQLSNEIDKHIDKVINGDYDNDGGPLFFSISNLLLDNGSQLIKSGLMTISKLDKDGKLEEL